MAKKSRPRILIADDEEGIRESLALILGDGYELTFAEDGQEALVKIGSGAFDLILLDIKMPKFNGIELMRELRLRRLETPVIVLSAYQSVELAREAVNLGAVEYLPKPFEKRQVLDAVEGAMISN